MTASGRPAYTHVRLIPLKLQVKNFMCYRDNVPELDLQGIHVACLSGDNGHGKSALLDSITWALWGQSRARRQDDLIHQGLGDMAVELEFSARSQRYRVSRRYARRGAQGHTILELAVWSGAGFTPDTLNSVRETEEHIRNILNLDYETFVNTAFLLQGKADMFTASTPAKRKEVLAEVLDLAYYETLEERAKQHSRGIQGQIDRADTGVELRREEVAGREEHEQGLAAIGERMKALEARTEDAQARHRRLDEAVAALRARASELDDLERRISNAEEDMAEIARRIPDNRRRVAAAEELIGRETEVRLGFEKLSGARHEVERLRDASLAAADLEGKISELDKAIAVERTRLSGDRESVRSRIVDELDPKAARAPGIESEIARVAQDEEALDQAESGIEEHRREIERLSRDRDALNSALEARTEIEARKAEVEREIAVQEAQLTAQVKHQSRRTAELKQAADTIDPIKRQLQDFTNEARKLDSATNDLDASRRELERVDGRLVYLGQANETLKADMEEGRRNFNILDEDEAECPVCKHPLGPDGKEHLRAEYETQGLDQKRRYLQYDAELRELYDRHKQLSGQVLEREASISKRKSRADGEIATLRSRLSDAGKAKAELVTAEAWLAQLRANLSAGSFAHDERARIREIVEELAAVDYDPALRREIERTIADIRKNIEARQAELNSGRTALRSKRAVLEAELAESRRASEELGPQRQRLQELSRTISTEAFAQGERRQATALRASLEELGYDAEEYRTARATAAELEPYDELNRKLDEATEALPRERESLTSNTRMLDRRRSDLQADRNRREELRVEVASMPAMERELLEARESRDSLEEQVREAAIEEGRLRRELGRLDRLQTEIERLQAERSELADRKSIYDELATAFGRNGIQALMIENAIPQIQDDANELLGRLTENRMSLKLQIMEGRRVRGVASEELDIRISDEVGTRSYEMFSGGEAFRINFALRIALSKLLARRSGAPLPILFIDEGFGSLDSVGQEHLKEAIQSIQADFEKIIVITHVEQVKEAFPVRIEVTKTPAGSTFTMAQ